MEWGGVDDDVEFVVVLPLLLPPSHLSNLSSPPLPPLLSLLSFPQVCAIQWSDTYKELISSHGFSDNQLILWKYSTMTRLREFRGHTSRVLHLAKVSHCCETQTHCHSIPVFSRRTHPPNTHPFAPHAYTHPSYPPTHPPPVP
jgi:WD40 repeat protein